jgi:hypothetical protein
MLPQLDYILLSHNHRDHCDKNSLSYLFANHPSVRVLTGLGLEDVIQGWTDGQNIQEAGWYQQYASLIRISQSPMFPVGIGPSDGLTTTTKVYGEDSLSKVVKNLFISWGIAEKETILLILKTQ